MYQILCVGEDEISDEHWQGYFELLKELKTRYNAHYSLSSWQTTRDRVLAVLKNEKGSERAFILKNGEHVAWAGFNGRNIGTPQQVGFFVFDLLGEHLSSALERSIGAQVGRWMDRYGLQESFVVAHSTFQKQVARHWRALELSRQDEYVLERQAVNETAVASWLKSIPARHPELRLEFFQMLPEGYVNPFAELLTETLRAMPEEARGGIPFHATVQNENEAEERRRKSGTTVYKYLLFDPHDNMVGMTLMHIDLSNPSNAFQLMTGVTGAFRGRGLGKWLKAAMFRKLCEDFPGNEKITTSMRALNKSMQAINRQMGFELVRQGYEFKVTSEMIADYLQSR